MDPPLSDLGSVELMYGFLAYQGLLLLMEMWLVELGDAWDR